MATGIETLNTMSYPITQQPQSAKNIMTSTANPVYYDPARDLIPPTDEHIPLLTRERPKGICEADWKKYTKQALKYFYQFGISPMAGISGLQGGMQTADSICHLPKPLQWCVGLAGWLGFSAGFAQANIPSFVQNKATIILSGISSAVGAAPSAVLTYNSALDLRQSLFPCLNQITFEWLSYIFAGTNGIANFVLGIDEGHTWIKNFIQFFKQLCDKPLDTESPERRLTKLEKTAMVLSGLIVAYLAATSIAGYVPDVTKLIAKFAPQWAAQTCGVFANIAEWMFQTNMMFTMDKDKALCCHLSSPLPEDWRENKVATASSCFIGLMSGIAMAGFAFETFSNPVIGYIIASTAWTGGFWTSLEPSYQCCAKPTVNCSHLIWERWIKPCLT